VQAILRDFGGVVRLFPLPRMVLFPDGFAPLNVFEPRYLELVKDALPDDGLIATALLKPGYEEDYDGSPAIHSTVSIGRILRPRAKPNGHIELLLYGIARARLIEEIASQPYRKARVALLEDVVPPGNAERVAQRLRRALELVPGRQPMIWGLRRMAEQIRGIDAAPGRYADAVAGASDLPEETLYEILEEVDVLKRFDLLIRHLEARADEGAPPALGGQDPRRN
jgi:Lon protease-like protein